MPKRLTNKVIQAAKAENQTLEISDSGQRGLILRVSPSGRKVWVYRHRYKGRLQRQKIGDWPAMKLSEARKIVEAAQNALRNEGVNPQATYQQRKQELLNRPTIEQVVTEYIDQWQKPRNRTWRETQRLLRPLVKQFGLVPVDELTAASIVKVTEPLTVAGKGTAANRMFAAIRGCLTWAKKKKAYIAVNPCADLDAPGGSEVSRERVLDDNELRRFWTRLDSAAMSDATRDILRLQLLTACRVGEVAGMRWEELQLESRLWTIPARRNKSKRDHLVPLSAPAIDILDEIPREHACVFHARGDSDHVTSIAVGHALRKNLDHFGLTDFRTHDIRRTVATGIVALNFGSDTKRAVLNHKDSTVTGRYDRHDYLAQKRAALDAWAARLAEIVSGANDTNVVAFRSD